MDKKCLFCKSIIPEKRTFCSPKCVKKSWYLRRNPNCYYSGSKKFWESATGIGFKWEKFAAKLLGAQHLEFNNRGSDLLLKNKYIDVKVSSINKRKNKRGKPIIGKQTGTWNFRLGKSKPDYLFLICLNENKKIEKILMIPFNEVKATSGMVIGKYSKYDKFLYKE